MKILQDKIRKANKNHICDFCGSTIVNGEKYNYQVNINEYNDINTWKSHLECIDLCDKYNLFNDEGVTEDFFCEFVTNKFCELHKCSSYQEYEDKFVRSPSIFEMVKFIAE